MPSRLRLLLAVLCILAVLVIVVGPESGNARQKKHSTPAASNTAADVKQATPGNQPPDFLRRMLNGKIPRLSEAQIEHYVKSRGADAVSLIVASLLSENGERWLEEAGEQFPEDPRVATLMLIKRGKSPEASEWVARLKKHDPGNSLGFLWAAQSALDGKDLQGALKELSALESTRLEDYRDAWQSGITDAYRSAGFRGLEAEWLGRWQVPVATGEMGRLSAGIADAMNAALAQGDRATAEALGRFGMKAAARVSGRGDRDLLIHQLISVSMERKLLNQLHVLDFIPGDERLVADRLVEMDKHIARIKSVIQSHTELLPTLSESELRQFTRRVQVEGELKAMEWLVAQRQAGR